MSPSGVPAEYRFLHKYLVDRFADVIVLRFAEIEDLLGCTLPHSAKIPSDWWAGPDDAGTPSAQSRAWTEANRTATPNFPARTVAFERVPG